MINRISIQLVVLLLSTVGTWSHAKVTYLGSDGMAEQIFSICVQCHAGERPPQRLWLSTYADAVANADNAYYRVQHGIMPPRNPLAQSQRDLFAAWLADGLQETYPPEIRNASVSSIGEHQAQLAAEVFEHGVDSEVWFTYGPSANNNAFSVAPEVGLPLGSGGGIMGTSITLSLTSLKCNTEYFYQSHIANVQYGTYSGDVSRFWTQPCSYKNQPPRITSIPLQTIAAGTRFVYQIEVVDPDDENNGKDLLFALANAPSGMEISATGLLTWQPGLEQTDSGEVRIIVSDGGEDGANSAHQSFRISVQQPDRRNETATHSGGGTVHTSLLLLLIVMLAYCALTCLKLKKLQ